LPSPPQVHRSQLIKARDALLKRDAANGGDESEADNAGFADAVGFLTVRRSTQLLPSRSS
jgi:hypothetical protein